MSLAQLKAILDVMRDMPENIPDEPTVRALLNQSMVAGVDASIGVIKRSDSWIKVLPYLKNAINDIPETLNDEIYGQFLIVAESFWPNFISSVAKSNRKKTHIMKILTRLVEEVRNATN
ncbi:MAG: hypothetical protein PHP89_05380 [Candidatus Omnitrophica bacterium]|nr:hypothetical protein [Candidatus Omnitrophota bacterium]